MSYEFYTLEKKTPIAWISLNRPEKKNAMHPPAWHELIPIFEEINADDEIRVVIIKGNGPCFTAGIDLIGMIPIIPELIDKNQGGKTKHNFIKKIIKMQDGLSCIERSHKPVIAAVHNYCIGAGLDLISACDIRLCSEDAIFSLREAAVAIVADMGSLQRLPHIIGQGHTRELAYTAKNIDAKRAKDIHLINEVYSDTDALFKAAEEMAMEIASNSPLAVQAAKDVLKYGISKSNDDALIYNATISANTIPYGDLMEAVSAFSERRKPVFKGV
jgi:enoyl-CoA hydratase